MASLIDQEAVTAYNKEHAKEIAEEKNYFAVKQGKRIRQTAIDQLAKDSYQIKSNRGKYYTAILSKDLKDVVIECPCKVDVVFHMNNAYIVDYFPVVVDESSLEKQNEAFRQLGGDY